MARKESFMKPPADDAGDPNLIPATVKRRVDRRAGKLNELNRDEKMLCALRKALSSKSGLEEMKNARYFISSENVYVMSRGGGAQAKEGELSTYTASGRFKMGIIYPKSTAYRMAQFSITYRDTVDDRGLPDVKWIEPTTIDWLPTRAQLVPAVA